MLQRHIDAQDNREDECRTFLEHAKELLVAPDVGVNFIEVEMERIENLGRSDYLVIADAWHSGDCCRRAYLWELKAPQCFIYERDIATRLKPSQDFIDAENQLLNYHYNLKRNGVFLEQYEIISPSDVSIGGIIIGCDRTKVNGDFTQTQKVSRYNIAKRVRDQLYDGRIKVKIWDEIRDFIGGQRRENITRPAE
jgi:hypothetical protein